MPNSKLKQLRGLQGVHKMLLTYGSNKSVPNTVLLAGQTYIVKRKVRTDELQLDKWLQNMPAATSLQKRKTTERKLMAPFSGVAKLYGTDRTAHNLYPGMTRSTDIGYDAPGNPAKQVDGMLIEIRDLQRDVALSNWKYVARDAALLTRFVNTGNIQEQAAQPEAWEASSSSSTALEVSRQSERETGQLSDSEVSEEMERIESMIRELPAEEAGGQGDALQADSVESHLPPLLGQSRRQSPQQRPQNLGRRVNPGHGNISFTQTNRLLGAVSSVRTTSQRTGLRGDASPVRRTPVNVVNLTFPPM